MIDTPLETINQYYNLWLWWRATGRKFLPSAIMNVPAEPFSVVLELDSYYEQILAQKRSEKESGEPS